ncbi:MAG: DUF4105 domain-containing protein [Cyclobacteriaceae bacterium]
MRFSSTFNSLILLVCLSLISIRSFAFSDQVRVSILTCDKGEEVYTAFGHSAIRFVDPKDDVDIIYNYGVFRFGKSIPLFVSKFLKGNLQYRLKKELFNRFKQGYVKENRSIYEQELNLNAHQIDSMYRFLEINKLPENQYYTYDFLNQNCTTKITDILASIVGKPLDYQVKKGDDFTFREKVSETTNDYPWLSFVLDFIQGRKTDRILNKTERLSLPFALYEGLKDSFIQSGTGNEPLIKKTAVIYKSKATVSTIWLTPLSVMWFLFITSLFVTILKLKSIARLIDFTLFTLTGIIGTILYITWAISYHEGFSFHMNALWLLPTNLLAGLFLLIAPTHKWLKYYFLNVSLLFIIALAYYLFHTNEFNAAILPLLLICILRGLTLKGNKFSLLQEIKQAWKA